jgi:hypothetical protein
MLNGDAHLSLGEGELRISRCRVFKLSARIIANRAPYFTASCLKSESSTLGTTSRRY